MFWLRDLIVVREGRGRGLGRLLITAAVEAASPAFLAGMNDSVHSVYRRLGYADRGRLPLYVRVFRAHELAKALSWPWPVAMAAGLVVPVVQGIRRRRHTRGTLRIEPVSRFDDHFEAWWRKIESSFGCILRRTSDTMTWRYLRHPEHRYTCLAARDGGGLRGIAIVRRGLSRGLAAGFVVELLAAPADGETMDTLLESAEDALLGAEEPIPTLIRATVLHGSFEAAFARAGYIRARSPTRWMLASARGEDEIQQFERREDWFLDGGDSDLDAL